MEIVLHQRLHLNIVAAKAPRHLPLFRVIVASPVYHGFERLAAVLGLSLLIDYHHIPGQFTARLLAFPSSLPNKYR